MNESVMIKPVGVMPNHLDLREITFTNLLLLEFNPSEMESKYRVVFNRDMFALPNKKAMEVIMHFLFTRLHPQLAYEEFRDCWPVRDKMLEQQFRKVCFNWVSRIQKEDPEAKLPRIVQSLFHSPGGERFYSFLHHFSLYVLVKVMHRDHGKIVGIPTFPTKTVHNQSFTRVMSKALEAHHIVLTKRFLEFTQYAVEVERHWKDFAMETTKEYRSLVKKKRELERQIRQLEDGLVSSHGGAVIKTDYQEEVEALKRTQTLHKVRDLWAGIEEFYSVQSPQRKIVGSVLKGDANKYQIDASDIQPRVPDLLVRDCRREIQMRNIEDTFLGGKVNLLSLIQLWNLSLKKIKDQICEGPIPSFEEHSPTVRSALHTHLAHLANTKTLREAIQETIPAIKEHINQMKSTYSKTMEKNPDGRHKAHLPFNLELGLIPPTPPWSFAAADTPAAERITSFQDTLKLSPDTVSTPEVIQTWRKLAKGKQLATSKVSGSKERSKQPEPSRLPRPKHEVSEQQLPAKSTVKKKKKPPEPQKKQFTDPRQDRVTSKLKERQSVPSSGLRSQNILADQIADAVILDQSDSTSASSPALSSRPSTPKVQPLEDPIGAFGQDAFQPRDLIPRTPAKSEPGYRLSNQKMTGEDNKHVRQPKTDSRYGRFLETILDQSAEENRTRTPKIELFNTDTPMQHRTPQLEHRTVLDPSGLPLTPQSVKMALFKDTSLPVYEEASLGHFGLQPPSDRKELFKELSPQGEKSVAYDTAFLDLSGVQQAPDTTNTSLFGRTPMSVERSQCLPHFGLDQTPRSTNAALLQKTSPGLGTLLLPHGKALENSGVALNQTTSPSQYDASPVDHESLGQFQAQLTPGSNETSSVEDTPPPLEALVLHREPILHRSASAAAETSPSKQHLLTEKVSYPQHEFDTADFERLKLRKSTGKDLKPGISPFHQNASSPGALPSLNSGWRSGVSSGSQSATRSAKAFLDKDDVRQGSTAPLHEQIGVDQSAKVSSLESSNAAFLQPTTAPHSTPSQGYEVDTRALIERLNKIKQTQQSTGTSVYTPARPFSSPATGHTSEVRGTMAEVSDTSLLVSRFDQIKQAQLSTTTSFCTPRGPFTSPALGHTSGVKGAMAEVSDTSLLASRLEQIKQSQLSTATSFYTPARPFASPARGHTSEVRSTVAEESDTPPLASRSDQIKQAQPSIATSLYTQGGSFTSPTTGHTSGVKGAVCEVSDTLLLARRLNQIKQSQLSTSTSVYTPARAFASLARGHTSEMKDTVAEESNTPQLESGSDQIKQAQLLTATSLYTPGGPFTSLTTGHTSEVKGAVAEVSDTSLLASRLDQIKQSQLSTPTSVYTPTRSFTSPVTGHTSEAEDIGIELSGASVLASRLNQIKQAQRSQQATPGANTGGDLSSSRPIEAALLTPLTPSSRDTPSEGDTQNGLGKFTFYSPPQHSFSPPGCPFPSPNDKLPQLSPYQETAAPSPAAVGWTKGDHRSVEGLQWDTATPILPQRQAKLGLLRDDTTPFAATVDDVALGSSLWNDVSTPLLVSSVRRSDIDPSKAGGGETFLRSFDGLELHENVPSGHTTPVERDVPISPVIGQLIDLE